MQPWPELLASAQSSGAALNTSTAQTSILPSEAVYTVPSALLIRRGQRLLVRAHGRVSNIVTTPGTLTLEMKLGSTVVASSGAMALNTVAKTDLPWYLEWDLTLFTVGSAATFMHGGKWSSYSVIGAPAANAGGAGVILLPYNAAPAVGNSFDSRVAAALDLMATWSVSNAGNSIQLHGYDLFIKN